MKSLVTYLIESQNFLIRKHTSKVYNYHPDNTDDLKELIDKLIKERGNKANLNDIDTLAITDMFAMFKGSSCNGDRSNWDVSNVKFMSYMFAGSKFTGDISKWNVSNVTNMLGMFVNSRFTGKNGDISNWDVSKVKNMSGIFDNSPLQNNIPSWFKIK